MGLLIGLVICSAVPAAAQTDRQANEQLWLGNYKDIMVMITVKDLSKLGSVKTMFARKLNCACGKRAFGQIHASTAGR
jgi:hypothetical protein